ncbi:MAG TPA: PAS domain-containing sensor histidine kinase [Gemmatimonadaceae bacterium]|nr:PAS domain-containing sensor histidine kinase [Gemmatimonadaceae bacterium]
MRIGMIASDEAGKGLSLAEGTGLYRLLVESVKDYAIFVLDPEGRVASWNEGAQRIKGYAPEDIIGKHFSTFYPESDIASRKPWIELEVAARDGRLEDEGWRVRKDGTLFWANVIITALRTNTGELVGFAKVTRDLTERRRSELRAVEAARRIAKAEASNQAKSEFLAAMSHELRTPLNAIGGYAELMELGIGGEITEQQAEYIARIRSSQQHLLGIINSLLNYSRIEAGQVTYEIEPVRLREVANTVMPLLEPQAGAKEITFDKVRCPGNLVALADRTKLEQILLNLLSNAVKFTPSGGRIGVICSESGDRVVIAVSDTGPGVPPDKLDAIFEPFVQIGRNLTSLNEGTGLGLAISRDLARAMGGDLTVESLLGSGSTFMITLPRAEGSPAIGHQANEHGAGPEASNQTLGNQRIADADS